MTKPRRGWIPRRRGWFVERGLFVASVLALVESAAVHPDSAWGGIVFVVAAVVCMGMVGLAWYRDDVSTGEVLVFALVARLLAFPLLPSLSDDGFRYVWDGWLQASGLNPFLYRPSDAALDVFQNSELYAHLNSTYYYSVYPPASQLVFWIGGQMSGLDWRVGWYGIKAVFVAIELGGVWALSRLVAPRVLLLYAWHPLVLIEGAGQGHTEAAMVGFLLVSVLAYRKNHPGFSVAALTVAGWFKLYPLVLLPFLFRRVGWRYLWVAGAVSLGLWLPYADPSVPAHIAESLGLYVRLFEFNAGPYYLLKQLGWLWTGADVSKSLGPLLQYTFLFGLPFLYTLNYRQRWSLSWGWLAALGLLWATATTVHPWYLLGVLALLPLTLNHRAGVGAGLHAVAWLWLSLASLATYLFYSIGSTPYWAAVVIGWSGWAVLLIAAAATVGLPALMQRRAADKWRWIRPYLNAPRRLLDLGAGEGYVGAEAARELDADVVLADVVDFNRTELLLVRYDGRRLPFPDEAFDATLLVFVLHHSGDPQTVLHEARRMTTGRVAVLESVVETEWDRRWLTLADRLANRVRSGGRMQEEHLTFGTVAEWRDRFEAAGFEVVTEERRGHFLHKRHLFILE